MENIIHTKGSSKIGPNLITVGQHTDKNAEGVTKTT